MLNMAWKTKERISIFFLAIVSYSSPTYLLTYLLAELSPSWGAANCAANILWNPKFQYRVHKNPSLVLSHINPIHIIPSCPSKIHFNIVHTIYILVFPVVSFLLAFPLIFYMQSFSPHSCYMLPPSHPSWLHHSTYTWRRAQIMKLLIMHFSTLVLFFTWQSGRNLNLGNWVNRTRNLKTPFVKFLNFLWSGRESSLPLTPCINGRVISYKLLT
jgi:hypothetical protein